MANLDALGTCRAEATAWFWREVSFLGRELPAEFVDTLPPWCDGGDALTGASVLEVQGWASKLAGYGKSACPEDPTADQLRELALLDGAPWPPVAEPKRVKLGGNRFHPVLPVGAVYVGRAAPYLKASPYANPFRVTEHGQAGAVNRYAVYLAGNPELVDRARRELAGRDLACWCPLDQPCHADVLLAVVRRG